MTYKELKGKKLEDLVYKAYNSTKFHSWHDLDKFEPIEMTQDECVEMIKQYRLYSGCVPYFPRKYLDDPKFIKKIVKETSNDLMYCYGGKGFYSNEEAVVEALEETSKNPAGVTASIIRNVPDKLRTSEDFVKKLLNNPRIDKRSIFSTLFGTHEQIGDGTLFIDKDKNIKFQDNKKILTECASQDPLLFGLVVGRDPNYAKNNAFVFAHVKSIVYNNAFGLVGDATNNIKTKDLDPKLASLVKAVVKYGKLIKDRGLFEKLSALQAKKLHAKILKEVAELDLKLLSKEKSSSVSV